MLLCLEYQDNIFGEYYCLKKQQISGIKCRFPYPVFYESSVILAVSTLTDNAKITVCEISLIMSADGQNIVRQVGTSPGQVPGSLAGSPCHACP